MLIPVNVLNGVSSLCQYIENGRHIQLSLSILCFTVLSLLGTGTFKIYYQIHKLKKDKLLRE
jgi:hypothetical protein